ncbi:MAG TPA: hypothetical protein VND64_26945, partial [Pirellulales bacterium]|nr:hypothetical protein [Pirellulales bacterium]
LTLVLRRADPVLGREVTTALAGSGVEFRRGTAGGGNQLRQPYLRKFLGRDLWREFPRVDHIHFYGYYIGNYPELPRWKIERLCEVLNELQGED